VPAAEESLRPTPQPAFPAIGGADALPNEAAAVSVAEPQLPAIVAELQLPAIDAEQSPVSAQAAQVAVRAHAAPEGELPRPLLRVVTPVGSRSWDAEFGQKIVLLAGRQESRAELTLAPPHMGRVEITLSVNGDQTSAAFVSASPAAREAIEQALPRLREVLAEAGITLGQASVNAESAGRDRSGTPAQRHGRDDANGIAAGAASSSAPLRRSNGLIDTFA
jgi:flagellar hook-length control protein FliK